MLDPANFEYIEHYLTPDEADAALHSLWTGLLWSQREITLFGRQVMQPRLIAWYGDHEAAYTYSGLSLQPLPWHPLLQQIRIRLEEHTGTRFNSVLANAYRNGSDSMGWHSDNERELGAEPVIASLSLGAERTFLVRRRNRRGQGTSNSQRLVPAHGSLLQMKGQCQQVYQHSIPKTRRQVGLRINLTYRLVGSQDPV